MNGTHDILLVEDNAGDVALTRLGLDNARLKTELHVTVDGEQALNFLRRQHPYTDAPRPALVLLDLNLPKIDGWEVLCEVKEDSQLCTIPVLILSTSSHALDIESAYRARANAYLTKSDDVASFMNLLDETLAYWCQHVRLASVGYQPAPKRRVLVVDDDIEASLQFAARLSGMFLVSVVSSAADAVRLLGAAEYDAVVCAVDTVTGKDHYSRVMVFDPALAARSVLLGDPAASWTELAPRPSALLPRSATTGRVLGALLRTTRRSVH